MLVLDCNTAELPWGIQVACDLTSDDAAVAIFNLKNLLNISN